MTIDPQAPTMVGWPAIISMPAITVAFVFLVFVGMFFGLYSTNEASKLSPIEALHYE
jgi:putative ABC transport system permease protein